MPFTMAVSPSYAAPEVIRCLCGDDEEFIDMLAHDIWSLGCILLEMLISRILFNISSSHDDVYAAARQLHSQFVSTVHLCGIQP